MADADAAHTSTLLEQQEQQERQRQAAEDLACAKAAEATAERDQLCHHGALPHDVIARNAGLHNAAEK